MTLDGDLKTKFQCGLDFPSSQQPIATTNEYLETHFLDERNRILRNIGNIIKSLAISIESTTAR